MVNSEKIKAKMAEASFTQKQLAEALGLAQATMSQKINNRRPFYLDEAVALSRLLGIEDANFSEYFFTQ